MARDNTACNRAIRKAWKRERELVLAGKGSRNWTSEQREQLITKGKVYDDDGKAFIGQHMKSVSGFPDNQGDADNIQLLSLEEHFEAHKRNWQTVTNWYYDPDTKIFYDFDVYDYSKFPPDDYIIFHPEEAIIPVDSSTEKPQKKQAEEKKPSEKKKEESPKPPKAKTPISEKPKSEPPKHKIELPKEPGLFSKVLGRAKKILTQIIEHPESLGIVLTLIKVGKDIKDAISGGHSSGRSGGIDTPDDYTTSGDRNTDFSEFDAEESITDESTGEEENDNSSSGTPKSPHFRRGYPGHRWKKNEDGDLELTETWISPAKIHPDQMDDEESEDE